MTHFFRPQHLTVQWHITDSCNLRCQHCYQPGYQGKRNSLTELITTAEEILQFHRQLAGTHQLPLLLTLTGGEPFAHPDFMQLLEFLDTHPLRPQIAILTNGTLLTDKRLEKLSRIRLAFIQLSLDGDEKTHDEIRGKGNFNHVLAATVKLNALNKRILWSFTVHKKNVHTFAHVAALAKKYQVNRLWFDRLIPYKENLPEILDRQQTQQFFQSAWLIKKKTERKPLISLFTKRENKTEVAMLRALQFQYSATTPYRCQAGAGLITIMPDGEIYPCRRLPVSVGNMHQTPLMTLYQTAPLLKQLRDFTHPAACTKCLFKSQCRGGLRCLAWAVNNDAFSADPGCLYNGESAADLLSAAPATQ